MTERIYNFAIVRVSPDPRRGELVNIGIVVFLRHKIDVRILESLEKVHALHGDMDLSELRGLPDRLAHYAKARRSVADRYALIRSVGMVELSQLGQFRAVSDADYERSIAQIITRLVRPTIALREKVIPQSRLFVQVKKLMREAKIFGRHQDDIGNHKVVQHYPLAPEKGLYADFAGRNSKMYVTETIDYRVDRGIGGAKFNESAKAAFVLRESQTRFSDSRRILLFAASPDVEAQVRPHLKLLGEFATDFVNFESAADRALYVHQLAIAFNGELPLSTTNRIN